MKDEIERFLRTGEGGLQTAGAPRPSSGGDFDHLALELFVYQFQRNGRYQVFCEAQGASPASVKVWQDIPAVPIGAFKSVEFSTFPTAQAAAVFHSSATTTGTPSRHFLRTLTFYETALKTSFRQWVLGDGAALSFLILAPSPAEAPHSSLSWMLDVVKRQWGAPGSDYFVHRGLLDEPRLGRTLRKMQESARPVALLGTTLAFLKFFDYCDSQKWRFNLPRKSRLLDTGGMKTQQREIARPEFVARVQEILGIPQNHCINEYGMAELSSQFYGKGASLYLQGPPWVRTLVMDRVTGKPAPAGSVGLLRHFDLANVDSVMAIQTEDLGSMPSALAASGGGPAFVFEGRASAAELKGCSLAAENYLR